MHQDLVFISVFQKSISVIDTLREMKSEIEGTQIKLQPVRVDENALGPLKQLALMHVPGSLTVDVKAQFKDAVVNMFQGTLFDIFRTEQSS